MGVYPWNNMGNLEEDRKGGRIDAVVHLGDHAYNIAQNDGRRGDGYMNGYQRLLAAVPWIPVIGNHEYYEGDMFERFLSMSQGVVLSGTPHFNPATKAGAPALSSFLTTSTVYRRAAARRHQPSANGAHSVTSRYYSENVGLIHFAAVDFSPYYFADTEAEWRAPQLAWLEEDLARVNRTATPWVVLMGHYPLYCSSITLGKQHADAEPEDGPLGSFRGCVGTGEPTVEESRKELEPLMLKYGVDFFVAGHEHDYESLWPVAGGQVVGHSFTDPAGPVHFVSGAAGALDADHFGASGPFDRKRLEEWSYGRLTAYNASVAVFEQVLNKNGSVFDEVVVTKTKPRGAYADLLARFYPEHV
eukprot:TRINITY_DN9584_c0_g1_i2.p2 TRINITY_DN9584_c0_g1~~TRINITY_DN9584_c0_g1_i2.p2  ORF type:complete len:359 (+),score=147.94 TRINITY_DN9584_c0_g1_i2:220-1296(+)